MKNLSINDFLSKMPDRVLLDVRTPAEYAHGHIPGALNLPLFSDEERAVVGTLYKQVSKEKAFLKGLDFAGAKMSWYVTEAMKLAPEKKVLVHCWRGGMRSGSLATLLRFAGFEVETLPGGYKAYRNFILENFAERKASFVVLGGKTGSGKTEILAHLRNMGEQVIDLEALAHHKGSTFGALGEAPQPQVEQFENNLFEVFSKIDTQRRTWVENESRSIGRVYIPQGFWDQIKSSRLIHVEMPFENRVGRLAKDYAHFPKEEIENALRKIQKRMGGQHVKAALEAFQNGDIAAATAIALQYYDKSYAHATSKGNFIEKIELPVESIDCQAIAQKLIELANEHNF